MRQFTMDRMELTASAERRSTARAEAIRRWTATAASLGLEVVAVRLRREPDGQGPDRDPAPELVYRRRDPPVVEKNERLFHILEPCFVELVCP